MKSSNGIHFSIGAFVWIVLLALAAGVIVTLRIAATPDLTPRETVLIAVVLSLFSIAASWLATHLYSRMSAEQLRQTLKREHTESLRTYALNAAEKVQNLSAGMGRLIDYVGSSLSDSPPAAAVVLQEKMRAAHLALQTLRSTNDTALSDWRGVIGDDLRRQADLESSIDDVYSKLDRLEKLSYAHDSSLQEIPEALEEVRNQIDVAASMIGQAGPIPIHFKKRDRMIVPAACPRCKSTKKYVMSSLPDNPKIVECDECSAFFSVTLHNDCSVDIKELPIATYQQQCVVCGQDWPIVYPVIDLLNSKAFCPRCGAHYLIHVSNGEVKTDPTGAASPKLLAMLKEKFGEHEPDAAKIVDVVEQTGLPEPLVKEAAKLLKWAGR